MADPIFSPDGKWMWTGSEWIPAPPSSASSADSTINLQDSMMSGDVKVDQNSNDASSTINLKDSAMRSVECLLKLFESEEQLVFQFNNGSLTMDID